MPEGENGQRSKGGHSSGPYRHYRGVASTQHDRKTYVFFLVILIFVLC